MTKIYGTILTKLSEIVILFDVSCTHMTSNLSNLKDNSTFYSILNKETIKEITKNHGISDKSLHEPKKIDRIFTSVNEPML